MCECDKYDGVVHTIKKGDTLYLISKFYKIPIGEIIAANREVNIYNLQIGDEIFIPVKEEMKKSENIGMNMKMCDLIKDESMTLEKFINLIKDII